MYAPVMLQNLKFAICEVTAFVGHSFAEKDKEVVDLLVRVLTKLGLRCDSGIRAEATSVSEKVRERIAAADIFVGILTRKDKIRDDVYSTSAWVIEEKAAALAAHKRVLLFVEAGVEEFGGLQGDLEYIRFDRKNLAEVFVRAMDYVLSLTSVPLAVSVDGQNRITMKMGQEKPVEQQLDDVRKLVASRPHDVQLRINFAKMLAQTRNRSEAEGEWEKLSADWPNDANVHHQMGHFLEERGDLAGALQCYQRALDLNPSDYGHCRCCGRGLYQSAKTISNLAEKVSTLNKAKRMLERASNLGGDACRGQINGDLFNVTEALTECAQGQ